MGDIRIVAGIWGRRRIGVPRGADIHPTSDRVREAWLNVLGGELEGARVVDLFAGTGALGLEALSRGAAHATLVERDRRVLSCLRQNVAALEAGERVTVIAADVFRYVGGLPREAFDVALADPPYERGLAARLIERYTKLPFARIFSIEHRADEALDLPANAEQRRYGDTVITFIIG